VRTFRKLLRHVLKADFLAVPDEGLPIWESGLLEDVAHKQTVVLRGVDEGQLRRGVDGPRHRERAVLLFPEQDGHGQHGVAVVAGLHIDEGHSRRAAVFADDEFAVKVFDGGVFPAGDFSEGGKTRPDDALDAGRFRGIDLELALGNFLQR
jgi:hypothetical protein